VIETRLAKKMESKSTHITMKEEEEGGIPEVTREQSCTFGGVVLTLILNIILGPLSLFWPLWGSFFTLDPQEEALVLFWGRLNKVYREPGIYWYNFFGRSIRKISTKTKTFDVKKTTVVDANGNPIIVSAVVTYRVVDTIRAAFGVEDVDTFLQVQALAILKKVASRYPYESKEGNSLQREQNSIAKEMVSLLQKKADICGANIISYELCDLQYAPEIAQGMLVRQQAQALLDARKVVVEGAVAIVTHAVGRLAENGIKLNDREQTRLTSNLLAVICSDARVMPTFSISESTNQD